MSNLTGDQHRALGAEVIQAPANWRYYFSPECEEEQMNKMQFVETTRERYDAHVQEYTTYQYGGKFKVVQVTTEEWFQIKVYHNPELSDIAREPDWTLVALALIDRAHDGAFSQYLILKEVEMGVITRTFDANGKEIK